MLTYLLIHAYVYTTTSIHTHNSTHILICTEYAHTSIGRHLVQGDHVLEEQPPLIIIGASAENQNCTH
jgi:hypothetical protein